MKKLMFFFCSLGALISCSQENVELQKDGLQMPFVVNEAVDGSMPVRLKISGGVPPTKALAGNPNESTLVNLIMTLRCHDKENAGTVIFEKTYQLGNDTDIIVNVPECSSADIEVQSGEMADGKYLTTIEGQKEHLYASGSVNVKWQQMQAQEIPFEITLSRIINKITIEKIAVDWTNQSNNSREFRIKKIFLCDVPRDYIESCGTMNVFIYNDAFTGERQEPQYYNFGGLDGFVYTSNSNVEFALESHRCDEMLMDEVDAVVSEDAPYTEPHIFYSYISNSSYTTPYVYGIYTSDGYVKAYPPMTTIVIVAELDGNVMYYRFPVSADKSAPAPKNTHIIFRELLITEAGSATLLGSKTYETFSYSFAQWAEDVRTDSVGSL